MLTLAPADVTSPIRHSWSLDQLDGLPALEEQSDYLGTSFIAISDLSVGVTCYRFRAPVVGSWLPGESETGEFWVKGFSPRFVGRGTAMDAAFDDWRLKVHETFQDLYGKRVFEMSEAESTTWRLLEEMINVVAYRKSTPLCAREVGCVSRARPEPNRITWIDGRHSLVELKRMPGPFAAYKPGQWFEAQVERDWATGKLTSVLSVQKIRRIQPMSEEQLSEFLTTLQGTSDLPDSDESWTEP